MEIINIVEKTWDCELTQLEYALKEIREIVQCGDCWINCKDNKLEFYDDYGNGIAKVLFK